MAVQNPSFEDAGLLPGHAEHWTLRTKTSLEAIAGFGTAFVDDPELAWEGFERWVELRRLLEDVPVVRAFFDAAPEGSEDFEETWQNDLYLFDLPSGQLATAAFGSAGVEDCEAGWDNDPYTTSWATIPTVVGIFGGELQEDFEGQWRDNEAFAWAWTTGASATAVFDAGTSNHEDFENDWDAATTF